MVDRLGRKYCKSLYFAFIAPITEGFSMSLEEFFASELFSSSNLDD